MTSWSDIRLLVTDFDGVWTDDAVYVDQHGTESVRCLRADGYGVTRLMAAGVPVIVLSAEVNPVVAARCAKLRVTCYQGLGDKNAVLRDICAGGGVGSAPREAISLEHVAYIGNDVNDIECLNAVGLPILVANAEPEVFEALGMPAPLTVEEHVWHMLRDRSYDPTIEPPVSDGYVTYRKGGYGALREVCELILEARLSRVEPSPSLARPKPDWG